MKCVRCGTELSEDAKVCFGCGFEVGKEYVPEENQTLESLYEIKEEKPVEDAEEMDIEGSKNEIDKIDGEYVIRENTITGENVGKVKKKRKRKYYLLIIPFILLIICLITYLNFDKIKCLYKNCDIVIDPDIKDDVKDVINHPTESYIFDNRILFKLTDEWNQNGNYSFNKNKEEFKLIKYDSNIENYLFSIGVTEKEEITINNIKYYCIKNGNIVEYILSNSDIIYVFSFSDVSDITKIMNTVIFYK